MIEEVENKHSQAWLFRNKHHTYLTIVDTRRGKITLRVMKGSAGALVADDYAGHIKHVDENELLRA